MSKPTNEELIKMFKTKKQQFWKNRETILIHENEKMEQQIIHLKKELHTIKKKGVKNLPLRRNLINLVIKVHCLKLETKLTKRTLQRRIIFHPQGILLIHSHQLY